MHISAYRDLVLIVGCIGCVVSRTCLREICNTQSIYTSALLFEIFGCKINITIPVDESQYYQLLVSDSCAYTYPDNLCNFKMTSLLLPHNNFTDIGQLSCLKNLQILDLSFNSIRVLKTGVFDLLPDLEDINLSNNMIHTIEPGVFTQELPCISEVRMDYNKLQETDLWIFNITHHYCFFNFSNNAIAKVVNNENFKFDNNFEKYGPGAAYYQHNQLTIFPQKVLKAAGLNFANLIGRWLIDLRDNPMHCDCHVYEILKPLLNHDGRLIFHHAVLNISCNSPSYLKGTNIQNLNLKDLVCNITKRCPPKCVCQEQPYHSRIDIECSGVGLLEMPNELPEVPVNTYLYLRFQNNYIRNLATRPYFQRTIYMDLSDNELSSVDISVTVLQSMTFMNLSSNRLSLFPQAIASLSDLKIDIRNNSLLCDCDRKWMKSWALSQRYDNITCRTSRGSLITMGSINSEILNCKSKQISYRTLGIVTGVIACVILFSVVVCGIFKYELMTIYYLKVGPKLIKRKTPIDVKYDVYISCDENNSSDRLWINDYLIQYCKSAELKYYVSFQQSIPGDVRVETSSEAMLNSSMVVAVVSNSYLKVECLTFELKQAHSHMVKMGYGKLVIIKRGFLCTSNISNRFIRAMLRLGYCIDSCPDEINDRLSQTIARRQRTEPENVNYI